MIKSIFHLPQKRFSFIITVTKRKYFSDLEKTFRDVQNKIMPKLDLHLSEEENRKDEADRSMKIQSLRDMVLNAEKTIQSAKAMLLQFEGKKKTARPRKIEAVDGEGVVVEGTFDGQIMLGAD